MEVTSLRVQLYLNVFVFVMMKLGQGFTIQIPDVPNVTPDKLQFFEYERFLVSCWGYKESNAWRVMRKLGNEGLENVSDTCSIPAPSCTIHHTFEKHSGEYWCENDEGKRSHALNISVTAGSVILNISTRPVEEGSNLTLGCVYKNTEVAHIADFYKDGLHLGTYYGTDLTLTKVTKSDEGFYKCTISKAGESPVSWLAVVNPIKEGGSNEDKQQFSNLILISSCTVLTLLFLLIGMILYKKYQGTALKNEIVTSAKDTTYASVNKPKKRNGGDTSNEPDIVAYAAFEIKKKDWKVSKATTQQHLLEQDPVYSLIGHARAQFN